MTAPRDEMIPTGFIFMVFLFFLLPAASALAAAAIGAAPAIPCLRNMWTDLYMQQQQQQQQHSSLCHSMSRTPWSVLLSRKREEH